MSSASWEDHGSQDTTTWKTTVDRGAQDYIFRSNQCLGLPVACPCEPATNVPLEGRQPDTQLPSPNGAILHACLQASVSGKDYFYEVFSDPENDASGTTFDRYLVEGGVDSFVDSNQFAALREPDGDLPWHQGVQIVEAMRSRGAWINAEPTTSASIEHDDGTGDVTLTFHTTLHGKSEFLFSCGTKHTSMSHLAGHITAAAVSGALEDRVCIYIVWRRHTDVPHRDERRPAGPHLPHEPVPLISVVYLTTHRVPCRAIARELIRPEFFRVCVHERFEARHQRHLEFPSVRRGRM
jgi:hypothetical protein